MTEQEEKTVKQSVRDWSGSVLLAIVLQTFGAIWWASNISASVQFLKERIASSDAYRATEIIEIKSRLKDLEERWRK